MPKRGQLRPIPLVWTLVRYSASLADARVQACLRAPGVCAATSAEPEMSSSGGRVWRPLLVASDCLHRSERRVSGYRSHLYYAATLPTLVRILPVEIRLASSIRLPTSSYVLVSSSSESITEPMIP